MNYTDEQKAFILAHAGKLSRRAMSKRLHVNYNALSDWCIELLGRKNKVSAKRKTTKQEEDIFQHDKKLVTI